MKGGNQGERKTEKDNGIIRPIISRLYALFNDLCE